MFGSHKSVKIDKALHDRLAEVAQRKGYSSTDEFITHLCERAVAEVKEHLDDEQVRQQLRGLGYIE